MMSIDEQFIYNFKKMNFYIVSYKVSEQFENILEEKRLVMKVAMLRT
jgi:hypothetical protein